MATRASHNKSNSAIKRIMQEARELANDPCTDYSAAPLEDDLFEWHCTIRGPPGTEFEGGLYHFRILLPAEYPFRPPSILLLTPNGRFELNTKICISFTNYHEELWQPAWGVRTAIIGLQGFFPLKGQAAVGVGSLEAPASERRRLAKLSRDWVCPHCQVPNVEQLPDPPTSESSTEATSASETSISSTASTASSDLDLSLVSVSTTSSQPTITITPPPVQQPIDAMQRQYLPTPPPTSFSPDHAFNPSSTSTSASSGSSLPDSRSETPDPEPDGETVTFERYPGPASAYTNAAETAKGEHAASAKTPSPRPPLILDATICVLLVFVAALLSKKILS